MWNISKIFQKFQNKCFTRSLNHLLRFIMQNIETTDNIVAQFTKYYNTNKMCLKTFDRVFVDYSRENKRQRWSAIGKRTKGVQQLYFPPCLLLSRAPARLSTRKRYPNRTYRFSTWVSSIRETNDAVSWPVLWGPYPPCKLLPESSSSLFWDWQLNAPWNFLDSFILVR